MTVRLHDVVSFLNATLEIDRFKDYGPNGLQVEGSDEVGAGYYFGWHTGDPAGNQNSGVAEFEDELRDRMTILTLDGGLGNQKLGLGNSYRVQSEFHRAYSIQAISKRK